MSGTSDNSDAYFRFRGSQSCCGTRGWQSPQSEGPAAEVFRLPGDPPAGPRRFGRGRPRPRGVSPPTANTVAEKETREGNEGRRDKEPTEVSSRGRGAQKEERRACAASAA
jgi:hypothetical protein